MKNKFVDSVLLSMKKKSEISESDERIYRYTLEGLYSLITKNIVVILIAIYFNLLLPTILLMLICSLIRFFAFGIHASKNLYCWFFTLTIYLLVPYLIKITLLNNIQYFSLYLIFAILLIVYSPADTPKRPLLRKEKRYRNQMIISILLLTFLLLTLLIDNLLLRNVFLYAIIIGAVCVNPFTYKIFKTKYNNYIDYQNQ